jgi:competence protein ComEA
MAKFIWELVMGLSMLSVFRSNTKIPIVLAMFVGVAWAQLPDGHGKAETEKICSQCHDLARSISVPQDRAGWETTVAKMVASGANATDAEIEAVIDYLAIHFPAETASRINVNKARAIELEAGLSLKRSEAAKVIAYRTKNGPFKSIEDLKNVPGIDAAKIEAQKDRLAVAEKP